MSDKYQLSRRKALAALGTIGVAGAGAGLGTSALYSDSESSTGNTITAGTQNLLVDVGIVDDSAFDGNAGSITIGDNTTADGSPAAGIIVSDMKPGDCFVIGFNPRVEGNPGYLAVEGNVTDSSDNINTEPEVDVDGDLSDANNNQGTDGELDDKLKVTSLGYEDGDANNGIPNDSPEITDDENIGTPLTSLNQLGFLYRNDSGESDPSVPAGHGDGAPTTVGGNGGDTDQVTHLVEICLPTEVGNVVQGDSLTFELTWYLEQARNNPAPSDVSDVKDGSVNS